MRPLLLVIAGDPVPPVARRRGSFSRLFTAALGTSWRGAVSAVDARFAPLPAPERFSAVIVSGSPSSVTEGAPWMRSMAAYLRRTVSAGQPLLGVCFGHQLLADALGGTVAPNPRGREIGTVTATVVASDALFTEGAMRVNMSHVDSVIELPSGAELLARTDREAHAAYRVGACAWGVQFHPEFDADVVRGYVEDRRETIASEGSDPDALIGGAERGEGGAQVLARFLALVAAREQC